MVGERCSLKDHADPAPDKANQRQQSFHSSRTKNQYSQPSKQSVSSDYQTGARNLEKEQPPMAYEERRCDQDTPALERVETSQGNVLRSRYQLHLMIAEQQAKRKLLIPKQEHWRKQITLAKEEGKETCPGQRSSGGVSLANYGEKLISLEQRINQNERKLFAAEEVLRVQNEGQDIDDRSVAERQDPQAHRCLVAPTSLYSRKRKGAELDDMLCEQSPVLRASSPKRLYRAGDAKIGYSDSGMSESPEGIPPTSLMVTSSNVKQEVVEVKYAKVL